MCVYLYEMFARIFVSIQTSSVQMGIDGNFLKKVCYIGCALALVGASFFIGCRASGACSLIAMLWGMIMTAVGLFMAIGGLLMGSCCGYWSKQDDADEIEPLRPSHRSRNS